MKSKTELCEIFEANKPETIHEWFELSYAQYLTVPRSVLQSMPVDWQFKFTQLLNEMDELIDWRPESGRYWVQLKDSKGRYRLDKFMDYDRGRRNVVLEGYGIKKLKR